MADESANGGESAVGGVVYHDSPSESAAARTITLTISKPTGQGLGILLYDTFFTREVVVEQAPSSSALQVGDVILFVNGFEAIDAPQAAELIKEASDVRLTVRRAVSRSVVERFGTDCATAYAVGCTGWARWLLLCCSAFALLLAFGAVTFRSQATSAALEVTKLRNEKHKLSSSLSSERIVSNLTRHSMQAKTSSLLSDKEGLEQRIQHGAGLLGNALSRIRAMEAENATLAAQRSSLTAELALLRAELEAERASRRAGKKELLG